MERCNQGCRLWLAQTMQYTVWYGKQTHYVLVLCHYIIQHVAVVVFEFCLQACAQIKRRHVTFNAPGVENNAKLFGHLIGDGPRATRFHEPLVLIERTLRAKSSVAAPRKYIFFDVEFSYGVYVFVL